MDSLLPELYPLRFQATYHRKIWGGSGIYKYKNLPSPYQDIGETWEISPMPGSPSIVSGGVLSGKSLSEVAEEYGAELLGQHVSEIYGAHFPLLVKLIDAQETLSVQVHPDNDYAEKHHQSFGKSEAWYLLECADDAKIYAGWKYPPMAEELTKVCRDDGIMERLRAYNPKPGDLYYLPAGRVHTIGAGCLLMEIQQASDLTYRVYDFNRSDQEGRSRELHIDAAREVLDYSSEGDALVGYDRESMGKRISMISTPYFDIGMLQFSSPFLYDLKDRDSFTILFVDEGSVMMEYPGGVEHLKRGDFLLIPASLKECNLMPSSEFVKLIDCYVPRV